MKKTVLVAGGAGFVGSHLCDALMGRGNFVVAVDNLSTGRRKDIRHLIRHPRFKFVKADVADLSAIALATADKSARYNNKIDEIYHLASPASPAHYQKDPIGTWKANIIGTMNLLELARKHKARFLFASTSEVYGDPKQHPQKESYRGNVNSVGPRACYDESKRAGETLCMDFYRKFKFPVKIVRIFNTYGPRMDKNDGRVVSNFIIQALAGKSLTVYGSGKQTRSFQYVDDLVVGLMKAMSSGFNFTGPVNLGNPSEFTILQLAKKIINLTRSKSAITYKDLPIDDPKQRKPDITLAKKVLKWQPKVNLEQGLKKTIVYFR